MQHWKQTPEGGENEERIDTDPTLPPSPEEILAQGGGGGLTPDQFKHPRPEPPAQGPEVAVDDVGLINLSDAPRDQRWFT